MVLYCFLNGEVRKSKQKPRFRMFTLLFMWPNLILWPPLTRLKPSSSCLPSRLLQVQAEIKRKWRRWMLQRFLGADTKYQQPSIGSNGNNFSTQITVTTKCSPATRRASECREHLSVI